MLDDFLRAAGRGDLPRVQRMLADGDVCITDADEFCYTALLRAAMSIDALPTLTWLLEGVGLASRTGTTLASPLFCWLLDSVN
jgi:hypothetical protein